VDKALIIFLGDPITHQLPYQIMTGEANGEVVFQSAARTYDVKGLQTNLQYAFNTKAINHKLQVGLRYHTDQADRYATSSTYQMTNGALVQTSVGPNGNQENQLRKARSLATFLSYDLSFKGLKLSPGIRYEKN
jgi:Fe(3+) dicitrate transport protein